MKHTLTDSPSFTYTLLPRSQTFHISQLLSCAITFQYTCNTETLLLWEIHDHTIRKFKVQMLGWQRQKQRKRKSFAAWAWSESSCRIRKFELQWWWWFPIWLRHWLISRISSAAPTSILQISPVLHFFGTFANLWKPLCTIVSLCIFSHTFVNILLHWSAYHGAGSLAILVFLHSSLFPNRKVKQDQNGLRRLNCSYILRQWWRAQNLY